MKRIALIVALILLIVVVCVFADESENTTDVEEYITGDEPIVYMPTEMDPEVLAYGDGYLELDSSIPFLDLSPEHWAVDYICSMAKAGVINGYPDHTFCPENLVKTGEFIKMLATTTRGMGCTTGKLEEGEHWALLYARALDGISYRIQDESTMWDTLERVITRGEVVGMMAPAYQFKRSVAGISEVVTYDESALGKFKDIKSINDDYLKRALYFCTYYNIINGFEDGTFRPDEPLTRAQAAKIMYVIKGGDING